MKRIVLVAAVFLVLGFLAGRVCHQTPVSAEGQGGGTPSGNGDVNGDGAIDISDGVYILNWLFTGGPAPKPIECQPNRLPATGQTKCYDNVGAEIDCASADFPGQDGFDQAGCPSEGRFVDNGDATVTDNCTGLIWQKETADVNGDGVVSPDRHEGDAVSWQKALKYCDGLGFAGHDDWRLPNVRELTSIVDYGRFGPTLDPVFGGLADWYWSSSSSQAYAGCAFFVNLQDGYVIPDASKVTPHFVRAVRNAP